MKFALTRAGMWFSISILLFLFVFGTNLGGRSDLAILLILVGIGFISGLLGFCLTLYNSMKEERELEMEERRKGLRG